MAGDEVEAVRSMSLERLEVYYNVERQDEEGLQRLPENFMALTSEYIGFMKNHMTEAQKEGRYKEVDMFRDQMNSIRLCVDGIFQRRFGKINGIVEANILDKEPPQIRNLLPHEQEYVNSVRAPMTTFFVPMRDLKLSEWF